MLKKFMLSAAAVLAFGAAGGLVAPAAAAAVPEPAQVSAPCQAYLDQYRYHIQEAKKAADAGDRELAQKHKQAAELAMARYRACMAS